MVARVPRTLIEAVRDSIITESDRLIVINKPAGIAVHGGSGVTFGIIEALRAARPDETLELVHRLDRDTSVACWCRASPQRCGCCTPCCVTDRWRRVTWRW